MLPQTREPSRLTRVVLPLALTAAAIAPFFCGPISETDAPWHLRLGELTLQRGLVQTNTLSWTHADHPWRQASWLYDVVAALAARAGLEWFQALSWLLCAGAMACVAAAALRADRRWGAWIVPLVALALIPRMTPRPHVISWGTLALCIAFCLEGRRWWCIPVLIVGNNFHAGAGVAAVAVACFTVEALWRERRRSDLLLLAACPLALLVLPGALWNVKYLWMNLHVAGRAPITEMQPGTFGNMQLAFAIAPLALLQAARDVRRRPAMAAIVFGLAAGALTVVRLNDELLIACAAPLASLAADLRARSPRLTAAMLATVGVAAFSHLIGFSLKPGKGWDDTVFPVRAVRFARAQGLGGRMYNSFGNGGYLEYVWPEAGAFIDGRVQAYPPDFFAEVFGFRRPSEFEALLRRYGVDWALIERRQVATAGQHMLDAPQGQQNPGWALVYWDERSEIWLRRDVPRLAKLVDTLEYRHYLPSGTVLDEIANASRDGLLPIAAEVDRYAQTAPDDPWIAITRCELAARLGKDFERACADAERVVDAGDLLDPQKLRNVLAAARQVAAAP